MKRLPFGLVLLLLGLFALLEKFEGNEVSFDIYLAASLICWAVSMALEKKK